MQPLSQETEPEYLRRVPPVSVLWANFLHCSGTCPKEEMAEVILAAAQQAELTGCMVLKSSITKGVRDSWFEVSASSRFLGPS